MVNIVAIYNECKEIYDFVMNEYANSEKYVEFINAIPLHESDNIDYQIEVRIRGLAEKCDFAESAAKNNYDKLCYLRQSLTCDENIVDQLCVLVDKMTNAEISVETQLDVMIENINKIIIDICKNKYAVMMKLNEIIMHNSLMLHKRIKYGNLGCV